MKCLVGAFVVSVIELRLATAPVIESAAAMWNPVNYVGEWVWINYSDTKEG
jgi:hypothetical protein